MSRLIILHPTDMVGSELRETLEQHRQSWQDLRLVSTLPEEIGTIADVRGDATFVQPLESDTFDNVDAVFFCGPMRQNRAALDALPPAATAILLSPDAGPDDGQPIVATINPHRIDPLRPIVSPNPGAIALAHLLHPLAAFGLSRATATLLRPISAFGSEALDEMLAQTRSLLNFSSRPGGILPTQMAFNFLPTIDGIDANLPRLVTTLLDRDLDLTVSTLQAGVFHSYAIHLCVELGDDPGPEAVRETLGDHISNELSEDPELLGPIDAAGQSKVLIGPVQGAGRPGAYWIWAVMDNLTCGGASNAMRIFEAVQRQHVH